MRAALPESEAEGVAVLRKLPTVVFARHHSLDHVRAVNEEVNREAVGVRSRLALGQLDWMPRATPP